MCIMSDWIVIVVGIHHNSLVLKGIGVVFVIEESQTQLEIIVNQESQVRLDFLYVIQIDPRKIVKLFSLI